MKKMMAMLLVFALLAANLAAVSAAAPAMPKRKLETADLLEVTNAPNRYEPMGNQALEEGCWIVPLFETYGQAAVIGDPMRLKVRINDECLPDYATCGVMIFKGTYDQIDDNSQPVWAYDEYVFGGHPSYERSFVWYTYDYSAGDYTALFFLMDTDGNVVAASAADLYLSKKEIPLESIDIYVYEVNDTPDVMYCANDGAFGIGIVFEPYHTTAGRSLVELDYPEIMHGSCNKPAGGGLYKLEEVTDGEAVISASYFDGVVDLYDEVRIEIKDPSEIIQFSEDSLGSCDGQLVSVDVIAPAGVGEIQILNLNPYTVEIVKVEGNTIYLRGLIEEDGQIAIYNGTTWDWLNIHCGPHEYYEVNHNPTCTEEGYHKNYCLFCGDIAAYEVYPAKGHNYGNEGTTVITEPTATKDGLMVGNCFLCGEVEEIIPRVFTDTQPDWFYSDALDYCYEKGIISGMTATTFGPTGTLNRAQLVTMLYRHAGSPAVEGENTFTDVPAESFYTPAVIWASENGIVYGYEDGSFRPGNSITRQELVTMLHRYMVRLDKDSGERSDLAAFEDLDQLMGYAEDAMQWAVANGVISGISATQLGPQQSANRAQTVTILHRIITGILGE